MVIKSMNASIIFQILLVSQIHKETNYYCPDEKTEVPDPDRQTKTSTDGSNTEGAYHIVIYNIYMYLL